MNIGIIGGGAVGLLVASYFHQQSHQITLYTRSDEQAAFINKNGIILSLDENKTQMCINAKKLSLHIDLCDILIVCVKQYNLDSISSAINQYKGNTILFLQNGMSHIELIEKLSIKNCFIGIVEHGALKTSANEITHTGSGTIKIGQIKGSKESLDKILTLHMKEFPLQFENDWLYILQQKCLINCMINPLTAIFNIKNGELITNDYFKQVSKLLFNEVANVLNLNAESEWQKVIEICEKTSRNYSSMNRDLFFGRQTEIDSMLGYVKKLAMQKKINVPTIELVYNVIKGLEKKKG